MSYLHTFRGSRSLPRRRTKSPAATPLTPVPFRSANPDQLHEFTANAQLDFSDDGASVLSSMERSLPSHRMMTMKEYDQKISDLNKENFSLKLRIYFLEEKMQSKFGSGGHGDQDALRANIELKVELESLKAAHANKNLLLQQTVLLQEQRDGEHREKMDQQKSEHEAECQRLRDIIQQLERLHTTSGQRVEEEEEVTTGGAKRRSVEWFRQAFSLGDATCETECAGEDPQLRQRLADTLETVADLNDRLAEGRHRIEELETEMSKKDDYIKNRETGIDRRNKGLYGLVEICKAKTRELEEVTAKFQQQSKELELLKSEKAGVCDRSALQDLEMKSHEIKELKERLNKSEILRAQHLEEVGTKTETINQLGEALSSLKTSESLLQQQLRSSRSEVERLQEAECRFRQEVAVAATIADRSVAQEATVPTGSLAGENRLAEQPARAELGAHQVLPMGMGVGVEHQLKLAQAEICRLRFLLESTERTMRAWGGRHQEQRRATVGAGGFDAGNRSEGSFCPRWSDLGSASRCSVSAPCTPVKDQPPPDFGGATTTDLAEQRLVLEKLCAKLEARENACPCVDAACQTDAAAILPVSFRPSSAASSSFGGRRGSVSALELHGGLCELLHVRLEELAAFLERLLRAEADGSLDQSRPRLLDEIRGHLRDCELSLSLTQTVYDTSQSMSDTSDRREDPPLMLTDTAQRSASAGCSSSVESGTVTLESSPASRKVELAATSVSVAVTDAPSCRRNLHLDSYELASFAERHRRSTMLAGAVRDDRGCGVTIEDERGGAGAIDGLPSYLHLSFAARDSSFLASTNLHPLPSDLGAAAPAEGCRASAVSESDSWSEPDRRVSRQRIGLDPSAQLTLASGGMSFGMSPGRARDYLSSTSATDGCDDLENFKPAVTPGHRGRSDHRETQRLHLRVEELEEINASLRAEVDLYRRSTNGVCAEASAVVSPRAPTRTTPRRSRARSGESSSASLRGADALSRRAFSTYLHEISALRVQLEKSISTYDLLREQFEKRLAGSKDNVQLRDEYCSVCSQLENCRSLLNEREAQLCHVKSEKDLLYAEIQELTEKFEAYRETIESLRTLLEEKRRCSAEAERRLAALEAAVESSDRATKEALNESERARKQLQAQSERLRRAEAAGEQLQMELARSQQLLRQREDEGRERVAELHRIRTESDGNRRETETLRKTVDARDDRIGRLESEAEGLRIRLDEMTVTNESFRVQLRAARSAAEEASDERQSRLVTELRGLHLQLERSVEVNQALRDQLGDRTDDNPRDAFRDICATTSTASSQEETSSSFAFSLRRASDGEHRNPTAGAATAVSIGSTAVTSSIGRQISKSSDYASVSDEGGRRLDSPVDKLKGVSTAYDSGNNKSPLSPDLGIESDRSRFSSLERRTTGGSSMDGGSTTTTATMTTSSARPSADLTTPYLKPGFPPCATDWTVVNTAPTKCGEGTQLERSVMLNATFAGFQKRKVDGNSIPGEDATAKEVAEVRSYRVSSQDDFHLLRRGIADGVKILCSVRERADQRLSSLRSGDAGSTDDTEVVAWRKVTSGCDALKACLRECCRLLGRSWSAPLPLISTDFEGGPNDSKQTADTVEAKLMRLYFELAKERKRAEEALHKLQLADRTKEKMEKAIIKQLHKTHSVLKKARGNLENQTKGTVTATAPLHPV